MIYSIDFEATQFSNRIISIGCVADNGNRFYTLVKPVHNEKVNNFITELTGITNEALSTAPTADEAFISLFQFIEENNDNEFPQYYCYGNNDKAFLECTIKYMKNTNAIALAIGLKSMLKDYGEEVRKYFKAKDRISLQSIYNFMQHEENEQKHNALEDAEMLMSVINRLKDKCKPEDVENIPKAKKRAAALVASPVNPALCKHVLETYKTFAGIKKYADARFDKHDDWAYSCIGESGRRYFDNIEDAVAWAIYYAASGTSPKKEKSINKVKKGIERSIKTNSKYCAHEWKAALDKEKENND